MPQADFDALTEFFGAKMSVKSCISCQRLQKSGLSFMTVSFAVNASVFVSVSEYKSLLR